MPQRKIDGEMTSFKLDAELRAAILDEVGKQRMAAYLRDLVRKDMEARGRVLRRDHGELDVEPVIKTPTVTENIVLAKEDIVLVEPVEPVEPFEPQPARPRRGRNARAFGPFMGDHPSYTPWRTMILKSRQTGIPFDGAWKEFWVFVRDLGPKPSGKVLMRLDQTQPWGPGNCSWATRREVNHRRSVVPGPGRPRPRSPAAAR